MATLAQVEKKLSEFGIVTMGQEGDYNIYPTGEGWYMDAWLPAGKTWMASGCHVIAIHAATKRELWKFAMEDLNDGISSQCDTEDYCSGDCDTCNGR